MEYGNGKGQLRVEGLGTFKCFGSASVGSWWCLGMATKATMVGVACTFFLEINLELGVGKGTR